MDEVNSEKLQCLSLFFLQAPVVGMSDIKLIQQLRHQLTHWLHSDICTVLRSLIYGNYDTGHIDTKKINKSIVILNMIVTEIQFYFVKQGEG